MARRVLERVPREQGWKEIIAVAKKLDDTENIISARKPHLARMRELEPKNKQVEKAEP